MGLFNQPLVQFALAASAPGEEGDMLRQQLGAFVESHPAVQGAQQSAQPSGGLLGSPQPQVGGLLATASHQAQAPAPMPQAPTLGYGAPSYGHSVDPGFDDRAQSLFPQRRGLFEPAQGQVADPEFTRARIPELATRDMVAPPSLPMHRSATPPADDQPRPKKLRDPNDYTFADYALGTLVGGLRGTASMALEQRQRHRSENRNRAGAEALFADLGLAGGQGAPSQGAQSPPLSSISPLRLAALNSARGGTSAGSQYAGMGPGLDGAPLDAPRAASPPAPSAPPLTRARLLAAVAKARAIGFDATPYVASLSGMLDQQDQEAFLSTAPDEDRALARIDPKGYAGYQLDRRKPRSGENDTVEFNPKTGRYETAYTAAPKIDADFMPDPNNPGRFVPRPGLKADPAYIARVAGLRAKEQRENAPPMWSVYGPSAGRGGEINSTGDVMGPIYSKIAKGVPLTGGEQKLYEDGRRAQDPLAALLGGLQQGGQIPRLQAPQAPQPSASPSGQAPRGGGGRPAVQQSGGVYRPTTAEDMTAIPKGAKFINPADGRVLTKAR